MPYTPIFLTPDDYDEIRDRLGNVDSTVIQDSDIEKSTYLQYAEAQIAMQMTDYANLLKNPVNVVLFKVMAVCLTAYLLVPKIQALVKSETIIDYAYTNLTPQDWAAKADALRDEGVNAAALILNPATGYSSPTMVVADGPTRLKSDSPASLIFPVYVLDPPTY